MKQQSKSTTCVCMCLLAQVMHCCSLIRLQELPSEGFTFLLCNRLDAEAATRAQSDSVTFEVLFMR